MLNWIIHVHCIPLTTVLYMIVHCTLYNRHNCLCQQKLICKMHRSPIYKNWIPLRFMVYLV